MTGEKTEPLSGPNVAWAEPPLTQPGARPPAPGELGLVQSFINSHYDLEVGHGADLFATPEALAGWLARRGLLALSSERPVITNGDVHRAVAAREGLRALARWDLEASASRAWLPPRFADALAGLNQAANGVALEVRFDDGAPRLLAGATTGLDRALGIVFAIAARAMIDGSWARLKVCPGEHCGWVFYDHSRNRSGRWCSMSVCGGRAKARAHYHRRRNEAGNREQNGGD